MKITIYLFWFILLIIFTNTILDHLFNFWFRDVNSDLLLMVSILYIIKFILLIYILNVILLK